MSLYLDYFVWFIYLFILSHAIVYLFLTQLFIKGSYVHWEPKMGLSIPNLCDIDDAANAHRIHQQTDQTNGTITF